MKWGLHAHSLRYALALWLATVLALLIAFVFQLEPAQWAAITVWIIFMQDPRMNYSKIIWWSFGTIVGACMAVFLTACFNQAPELLLLFLALWLALCAGTAKLVRSYKAYGWVLAGYTCAIVTMSAAEHPDLVFRLAVTRVSCIFTGMASAILLIVLFLPRHDHWKQTLHQLGEHLKATLLQAAKTLIPDAAPLPGALSAPLRAPAQYTWRHMADRLSTLEHTLDITTAESADSRVHTPQACSLVAALFELRAKAQAIEVHRSRPNATPHGAEVGQLLGHAQGLLTHFAKAVSTQPTQALTASTRKAIACLRNELALQRRRTSGEVKAAISARFVLERVDELLAEFDRAIQDWAGLFGPWTARRRSRLAVHLDFPSALVYGVRMFLAVSVASILWFITQWPSGSQFILFIAVVCSLLSLVDYAPELGWPFLKSAVFCAIMAYVESFCWLQWGGGFLSLALMLGVFLVPAAYAYRHPRLLGGAVVSMLIFYGLSMPANQMNYDIVAFLNNGLALLAAAACGFFAFHAVPSLGPAAKRLWLLRAVRRDLAQGRAGEGALGEQGWASCMFDRLRLLHRTAGEAAGSSDVLEAENEMLIGLQLGLRQDCLKGLLSTGALPAEEAALVAGACRQFREIYRHPASVVRRLRSACTRLEEILQEPRHQPESVLSALAEMQEMTLLLKTSTRLYAS